MRRACLAIAAGAALLVLADARTPAQSAYEWTLPAGFRPSSVPGDNPMSEAKVTLGGYLFYDTRLSGNGTQSCGTCHEQSRAFTDGRARSVGSTGEAHPRGSMSLVNVAYAQALTWANPSLHIVKAIATFQRAIVSARSPCDRYHFNRDNAAISESARHGEVLFHSRPLSCFTCHGGDHFSGAMGGGRRVEAIRLHNTGLYNLAGPMSYPAGSRGLYDLTQDVADVGKFKAPTLRNIAVTAPYMHDGSVATLERPALRRPLDHRPRAVSAEPVRYTCARA